MSSQLWPGAKTFVPWTLTTSNASLFLISLRARDFKLIPPRDITRISYARQLIAARGGVVVSSLVMCSPSHLNFGCVVLFKLPEPLLLTFHHRGIFHHAKRIPSAFDGAFGCVEQLRG